MTGSTQVFTVDEQHVGQRLDAFLAGQLNHLSRSKIRVSITAGQVFVNERTAKPSHKLLLGEVIRSEIIDIAPEGPRPENIPLDVLHDDQDFAVINKPAGMVVHPSKGHWEGTLTSALAYHFQHLSSFGGIQRPGIVHRLDRDTSGVIVIAKNDRAHQNLAAQFEQRTVEKEYLALVSPPPDRQRDWIDQPIGPHPYQREKMAIRHNHPAARAARTFFEVTERWGRFAQLKLLPKTGRTHQIRVHLQHLGCPILADKLYSGSRQVTREHLGLRSIENPNAGTDEPQADSQPADSQSADSQSADSLAGILLNRQALHARRLQFQHPVTKELISFEAEIPDDIQAVITAFNNG